MKSPESIPSWDIIVLFLMKLIKSSSFSGFSNLYLISTPSSIKTQKKSLFLGSKIMSLTSPIVLFFKKNLVFSI